TGKDHDEEPAFKADEPAPDAGLETEEKGAMVQKALLELDEESRVVIVLREIEGQSYSEIAQALDIPEGTVKSPLFRAREALKARVQGFVPAWPRGTRQGPAGRARGRGPPPEGVPRRGGPCGLLPGVPPRARGPARPVQDPRGPAPRQPPRGLPGPAPGPAR